MSSDAPERAASVLVVNSEPTSRERLRRVLEADGCEVRLAAGADEALRLLEETGTPDVVVVDAPPRATAALRLCEVLRRRYADLSLLLIAGANRVEDRIAGLRAGADDCVGRPFAAEEIAARVDVLLRRDGMRRLGAAVLRHGSLVLNRATRQAYQGDARLELTRTEFDLLELFLLYPGEALRRSFIYERVWDSDARYHSNSLEVYVSSLRRKLEKQGHSRLIHTLRGVGYVLRGEPG